MRISEIPRPSVPLPYFPKVEVHVRAVEQPQQSAYSVKRTDFATLAALAAANMTSTVEQILVMGFGADGEPLGMSTVSIGDRRSTTLPATEFLRQILNLGDVHAVCIIHNHPSGYLKPSEADQLTTNNVATVLGACGIGLIDHIIIGKGQYLSFRENDLFMNTFVLPHYVSYQLDEED